MLFSFIYVIIRYIKRNQNNKKNYKINRVVGAHRIEKAVMKWANGDNKGIITINKRKKQNNV